MKLWTRFYSDLFVNSFFVYFYKTDFHHIWVVHKFDQINAQVAIKPSFLHEMVKEFKLIAKACPGGKEQAVAIQFSVRGQTNFSKKLNVFINIRIAIHTGTILLKEWTLNGLKITSEASKYIFFDLFIWRK